MSKFRVTGAVVAHRTLNPLVLGSNPRSPINKKRKSVLSTLFLFYRTTPFGLGIEGWRYIVKNCKPLLAS
jgi:hypothetical protein